jgi:hypothetical protein
MMRVISWLLRIDQWMERRIYNEAYDEATRAGKDLLAWIRGVEDGR